MKTSRRDFVKRVSLATGGLSLLGLPELSANRIQFSPKISVFSKNLQWLSSYDEMAITAKEIGFTGIDLTVRPNGHVLPERVATDLPKAVAAVRKAGLEVTSITTTITEATDPYTEPILSAAQKLGIQYYRLNWFDYEQSMSIRDNLTLIRERMKKLAAVNEKYQIHGAYQNHAGTSFGASIWDMYEVLKDFDPQYLGCQYDVRHAIVEGSNSWVNDLKLIHPYVRTTNIKDFQWTKKDNKWQAESVPLGEGMVDFKKYFELIRLYDVKGPVCMHFEYPLGGADQGARSISITREKVMQSMRQDLSNLTEMMAQA
jgi:sugar phosphate isomerase/epimerase